MAGTNKKPIEEKVTDERSPLFHAARQVLLAGVGAVALAQDEVEDFVRKLVERGQLAESEGKNLVVEVADKRRSVAQRIGASVERQVEEVLVRLNIPAKRDVDALSEKVAELAARVAELTKSE